MNLYIRGTLLRAYEGWASELNSGGMGAARRFAGNPYLFIIYAYIYVCIYIVQSVLYVHVYVCIYI